MHSILHDKAEGQTSERFTTWWVSLNIYNEWEVFESSEREEKKEKKKSPKVCCVQVCVALASAGEITKLCVCVCGNIVLKRVLKQIITCIIHSLVSSLLFITCDPFRAIHRWTTCLYLRRRHGNNISFFLLLHSYTINVGRRCTSVLPHIQTLTFVFVIVSTLFFAPFIQHSHIAVLSCS